jgi:hypothetical protein
MEHGTCDLLPRTRERRRRDKIAEAAEDGNRAVLLADATKNG